MSEMHDVSVVMPVKNGMGTIQKCLDGIFSQSVSVKEIVVIDSGSTDGTIDFLKQYDKVKLIEIPADEFNHGETRNLGVNIATGEIVVLTVQDAWPTDEFWIENLLKGMVSEDVVAVCGQQVVPHEPDKNPAQWFRPYSVPKVVTYHYSKEDFEALSPSELQNACRWDNVTALYRRSVLLKMPFRNTLFAEDATWAKDALQQGYTIAYNYTARVYHYHHEDAEFAFKRYYAEIMSSYRIFGLLPAAQAFSARYYFGLAKTLLQSKGISFADKLGWWNYNINLVRSYIKASNVFRKNLEKGQGELESSYYEICNNVSPRRLQS